MLMPIALMYFITTRKLADNGGGSMEQKSTRIKLDIKELSKRLCPKCQRTLRELIKERITDGMVDEVIGKEEV